MKKRSETNPERTDLTDRAANFIIQEKSGVALTQIVEERQAMASEEDGMFWFGFLVGAAAATAFILYGNGELLVRLSEQMKKSSDRFREWQRERTGK